MLQQIRRDMDRMMGETEANTAIGWVPAVDIRDDANSFTFTADEPSVEGKDI